MHEGMVAQNAGDWPRPCSRTAAPRPAIRTMGSYLSPPRRARLARGPRRLDRVHRWYVSFEDAFERMRGVYEEAMREPTLGVAPHPELYHRLADLREQMGRPDEAPAWHRLVLRDDAADPTSLAALRRLEGP